METIVYAPASFMGMGDPVWLFKPVERIRITHIAFQAKKLRIMLREGTW